jgi:uncharacterized protein YutE (UPF0331/DUF86 family)
LYFVDREKIEKTLQYLEQQLELLEGRKNWENPLEKKALERIAHTMIDAVLDVGNAMIDGFIMRDPGSYEDIIDILTDEKVISEQDSVGLKEIIGFRKMLVQDYLHVDHQRLLSTLLKYVEALKTYPSAVRFYLENELGPVSAFRK